jgi:SAM-dependent methyltransferase
MESAAFSASELLDRCPVCQSAEFAAHLECRDHIVSQRKFQLVKCQHCGFIFTNPRPTPAEIGAYYESKDYLPHTGGDRSLQGRTYRLVRRWALGRKLALVNALAPKGRLLDIGCGTGEFLNRCRRDGWDVCGVEPSEAARAIASKQGAPVVPAFSRANYAAGSLDVITMWHVMEHVHDLNGTVTAIAEILKPSGCLVVAVPNQTSHDAAYYGAFWAAYDVPRHLSHFSPAAIRRLVEPAGMRHERTCPLWFDSVYVSSMAERYRHAETGCANSLIRAGLVGLCSNVLSLFRNETCSSQIYIFRKETARKA